MEFYKNSTHMDTATVKTETRNGRTWLVAPVVAAVESVMNGRLVLEDALVDSVQSLNGRPITVNHPQDRSGGAIPANSPDVQSVGIVFNARIEGKSLKADAWFDVAMVSQIGAQGATILKALKSGKVLEVSLGWFANMRKQTGTFANKAYTEIVSNIAHDHLAILMDEKGACSIADGCGLVRNEAEEAEEEENKIVGIVKDVLSTLGFSQKKEIVIMAEQEAPKEPAATVITDNSELVNIIGNLAETVKGFGDMIGEVNDRIDEIVNNAATEKTAPVVARLVANSNCSLDEEALKAMSVETLTKLEADITPANYSGASGNFYQANSDNEIVWEVASNG